MATAIIANSGNFKNLLTYRKAEAIYDLTFWFCERYIAHGDRTKDQMVQAARSGKQNIAEGSAASATSSETEIHLTNVAKASLKELLADYEDWLRVRDHRQWEAGSKELEAMRRLGRAHNDGAFFVKMAETRPPETVANMAIVLIKQEDYLLARQLAALEKAFKEKGGIRERMHTARTEARADGWDKALYSKLDLAKDATALARTAQEMRSAIDRAARSIARRKGWQ
ncbi:MAG: four helix bundle suffix domain-containing protein [Kiritimatiellae bacterium]|nr:four helix bundle suffix domain-containing protein [Kiritimatiellia bacterium]